MPTVRVPTRVRCAAARAVTTRVQGDVAPFTSCGGIDVRCVGRFVTVTARCPKGEARSFRSLVRRSIRYPILSGVKVYREKWGFEVTADRYVDLARWMNRNRQMLVRSKDMTADFVLSGKKRR